MMRKLNNQLFGAWLLLLATAALTSCSQEDEPRLKNSLSPKRVWTISINAGKADGNTTRGVFTDDDGASLKSKWLGTETFTVSYGGSAVGTVTATASETGSTTIIGTLNDAEYAVGQTLTLTPTATVDYSGQTGTVESVSQKDFLNEATVTISSVGEGTVMTTSSATFSRKQSFTKFTFNENVSSVTISADGLVGSPVTITPASATNTIYAALSNTSNVMYRFSSTIGGDKYSSSKSADIVNGNYYITNITLYKNPKTLAELKTWVNAGNTTTEYAGYQVDASGNIAETVSAPIGYVGYYNTSDVDISVPGSRILVLAAADIPQGVQAWGSYGTLRNLTTQDMNGYSYTKALHDLGVTAHPAGYYAWEYNVTIPSGGSTPAHWFMPSRLQLAEIVRVIGGADGLQFNGEWDDSRAIHWPEAYEVFVEKVGWSRSSNTNSEWYWTSTEWQSGTSTSAWYANYLRSDSWMGSTNYKYSQQHVRCCFAY